MIPFLVQVEDGEESIYLKVDFSVFLLFFVTIFQVLGRGVEARSRDEKLSEDSIDGNVSGLFGAGKHLPVL